MVQSIDIISSPNTKDVGSQLTGSKAAYSFSNKDTPFISGGISNPMISSKVGATSDRPALWEGLRNLKLPPCMQKGTGCKVYVCVCVCVLCVCVVCVCVCVWCVCVCVQNISNSKQKGTIVCTGMSATCTINGHNATWAHTSNPCAQT